MRSSRKRTARSSGRLLWGVSASMNAWIHPPPGRGLDTPRPGPGHPLGLDLDTPLGLGLDTPLACHVTCKAYWDTNPPTLWTEFLTHASENITLPQLRLFGLFKIIRVNCSLRDTTWKGLQGQYLLWDMQHFLKTTMQFLNKQSIACPPRSTNGQNNSITALRTLYSWRNKKLERASSLSFFSLSLLLLLTRSL